MGRRKLRLQYWLFTNFLLTLRHACTEAFTESCILICTSYKMTRTTTRRIYENELKRPWFAPPGWIFGPVWALLYVLIAVSYGFVFHGALVTGVFPKSILIPLIINLIANLSYTPIQFTLGLRGLATLVILVVLGTIVWTISELQPFSEHPWLIGMQIPYLLWVAFATVLQVSVWWMNRQTLIS